MIPAFHRVRGISVREIVKNGVILPAAYRTARSEFDDMCTGFLKEQESWDIDPNTALAIRELAAAEADRYELMSARLTGKEKSFFGCVDLLAGDAGSVFLSLHNWLNSFETLPGTIQGFIYDAEDLVKKGACYRRVDFERAYMNALDPVLFQSHASPEAAMKAIERSLDRVRSSQICGKAALKEIRKNSTHQGEIVWEGPLPVEWALEIVDGRLRA